MQYTQQEKTTTDTHKKNKTYTEHPKLRKKHTTGRNKKT